MVLYLVTYAQLQEEQRWHLSIYNIKQNMFFVMVLYLIFNYVNIYLENAFQLSITRWMEQILQTTNFGAEKRNGKNLSH